MRPPRGGGSFRGRGGRDGSGRGGGGRFNRGGGRFGGGGGGGWRDEGPPDQVVEVATFVHASEGDAVTKLCQEKIPHFNAPIYLQNKTQIGKVDEIFGDNLREFVGEAEVLLGAVEDSQPEVLLGAVEDSPALEVLPGAVEDSPEAVGEEDTNLIALVACSFAF
ncbi:hypothetical protein YC2023_021484 [Brassica napus]